MGLIKRKGDAMTLSPDRFKQFVIKHYIPFTLLKKELLGYAIVNGIYWIICREGEGVYSKVPFAKNKFWWDALVNEVEFMSVGTLPQIFITGIA
jgi:hypothetical protein